MGLFRKFVSQTRKPEGLLGKMMVNGMNGGHAKMADWGMFMIVNESDGTDQASLKFEKIIDGMKCYTVEEIEAGLKSAGFSKIKADHHKSKPWITVIAKK